MSIMSERLTQLREKNKLTQADVAKRLSSTPALVSAYETGERKPSIEKLSALADIYHSTTDYILGRTAANNDSIFLDVTKLSENQIKLLRDLIEDMAKST